MSLIHDIDWGNPDETLSSDSCLTGGGGFAEGEYFDWKFPDEILRLNLDINQLECMVVTICLGLWGNSFSRKKITLFCDNNVTIAAINSGFSRNEQIQRCLRKIHLICAKFSFKIKMEYLTSKQNKISDALSRWHIHDNFQEIFRTETKQCKLHEEIITQDLWEFVL